MSVLNDIPPGAKLVCYVPIDGHVAGHGYRVSIVVEGESGHRPTGNWPYTGKVGETMPWFWGDDFEKAVELANEHNERMGISKEVAWKIIYASIQASMKTGKRKGKRT